MRTMYTINGEEVNVTDILENGFLGCITYVDEDGEAHEDSNKMYFEKLYKSPVTVKISEEINRLTEERDKLQLEVHEIKQQSKSFSRAEKIPALHEFIRYVNGEFTHLVWLKDCEVIDKNSIFASPYIAVAHTKNDGYELIYLRNETYLSSDDRKFRIFNSEQEANDFAVDLAVFKIKNTANYSYFGKGHVETARNDIAYKLRSHPLVVDAFNETMKKAEEVEDERIKLKIAEKEAELEKLKQSI